MTAQLLSHVRLFAIPWTVAHQALLSMGQRATVHGVAKSRTWLKLSMHVQHQLRIWLILYMFMRVCAKLLQSCPTFCNPMDCSPPGSSVHGILQARILEWIAMPSSRGSSQLRDQTLVSGISCIAGGFFTCWAMGIVTLLPKHNNSVLDKVASGFPSHRGVNWGVVTCKRSHSQFGDRETTGAVSSWCKASAHTGLHQHRGQPTCPSLSFDHRSYLWGKGKGRHCLAVCRTERESLVEKPDSRYDNNNMPRPSDPLAFKKRGDHWEEILT